MATFWPGKAASNGGLQLLSKHAPATMVKFMEIAGFTITRNEALALALDSLLRISIVKRPPSFTTELSTVQQLTSYLYKDEEIFICSEV
jgi:hypothetical protein